MGDPIACILCKSDSVFPLELTKNRSYLCCQDCDLIIVPASFHLSQEDEMARYRLHDNTLLNEGYVRMFLEKISIIHQYCLGIHSVLDYGCGPEPVLAELMKREGFDCDIYDPYFFPELPKKSYDLVISMEVFEHFRNVRDELRTISSLLTHGGFLAVMTSFHDAVADFSHWWYISDPTHICFFSKRTFEWIANEFGFKIIFTNKKDFIILQNLDDWLSSSSQSLQQPWAGKV